jgi:hypothetical protein
LPAPQKKLKSFGEAVEPFGRRPDLFVLGDCNFQLNTTAPPTIILRRAALCVLREIREGKDRIASAFAASADAVVARAPRNDGLEGFCRPFNVIASEARQSRAAKKDWIASSQGLLAMTDFDVFTSLGKPD